MQKLELDLTTEELLRKYNSLLDQAYKLQQQVENLSKTLLHVTRHCDKCRMSLITYKKNLEQRTGK